MARRLTWPRRGWVVVLVTVWVLFAVLAAVIAAHHWAPFGFEQTVIDWSVAHRPQAAKRVALSITSLGSGTVPYLLALAAGALGAWTLPAPRPRRRAALLLVAPLLWLIAGQLLREGLMHAFARPRPPMSAWATSASGFSFPSGHAFTGTVSAGLLAIAVCRARPAATRPVVAFAAVFAVAVGLTRVYLGVHWPLDVLGGWLLAAGWLAAATAVLPRADTAPVPPPAAGVPDGRSAPDTAG